MIFGKTFIDYTIKKVINKLIIFFKYVFQCKILISNLNNYTIKKYFLFLINTVLLYY